MISDIELVKKKQLEDMSFLQEQPLTGKFLYPSKRKKSMFKYIREFFRTKKALQRKIESLEVKNMGFRLASSVWASDHSNLVQLQLYIDEAMWKVIIERFHTSALLPTTEPWYCGKTFEKDVALSDFKKKEKTNV